MFFTLCGKADPEGCVSATVDGIRRAADLTAAEVDRHLLVLSSPDLGSKDRERDGSRDGRRIEKIVGGWKVLNIEFYRELARQEADRARKRKWWNENRGKAPLDAPLDDGVSSARRTETETETETETKTGEEAKSLSSPAEPAPDAIAVVRSVFDEWRKVHAHPNAKLDPKRTARIRGALKLNPPETLKQAIRGALKDDWLMGRDPKSPRKYDGLETILRDAAMIERLADIETGKVQPARKVGNGSLQRDVGVDPMQFFKGVKV